MKHISPIFGLIFLLSSCIKNNPDPVWIKINEWTLEANPNATTPAGELTEDISDAWVFVGNEFIGVFELPCEIPVITNGTQAIRVYPTVLNNGISATKKIYPFLDFYEVTADLVENETVTLDPVTRYKSNVNFWIEDFENSTVIKIENDPTSDATIQVVDATASPIGQPSNGNGFGCINLSETVNRWIAYSDDSDVLNLTPGQDAYVEIDYHNTNRITSGLLAVSPSGTIDNPNIQMNPQSESEVVWKKIYIELKEIVGGSDPGAYFQLSFLAVLDDEDASGQINIDNIKVVYY
ncbi:MAG: hypothetical protein P8P74_13930 [Crocinitomicaceae bacterium]|nr:hypothetical protein [Crocinitomicaceae bacterium]